MNIKKITSWLQSDIFLFILMLSPFIYIIGKVLFSGVPDVTNSGDGALLEMSTRSLFSRRILLGPYSRFLFFHPGPLYFFVRYPFYVIMGQRNSSFLIVTSLISMASLFGSWFIVKKLLSKFASYLFIAVFALFLLNTDKVLWLSEWNPHIILFPVMLFSVVMAAVSCRNTKYLYLGVITGSFVAQTHIGGIPVLAGSFVIAVLCAVYPWIISSSKNKINPRIIKQLLISFVFVLLLWASPIYEEITADEQGNFGKIQEFFEETESDHDLETAFDPWSNTLTSFELDKFSMHLKESGLESVVSLIVVAFRMLLLVIGFSLLRRRGKFGFLCALNLICLVLHGVTYYSVSQVRGELYPYLIEWMKMLAPLSLFTILVSLYSLLSGSNKVTVFRKYFAVVVIVFVFYSSFILVRDVNGYFNADSHDLQYAEKVVQELSIPLGDLMEQHPESYFILKLQSRDCWQVMFGLMNKLEKEGYNICMDDNVWFTSTLPPAGTPTRILHIGSLNSTGINNPGVIARHNDIGVILQ